MRYCDLSKPDIYIYFTTRSCIILHGSMHNNVVPSSNDFYIQICVTVTSYLVRLQSHVYYNRYSESMFNHHTVFVRVVHSTACYD